MNRTRIVKLNPVEPCGGRKAAADVTDRALRYRANSEECKPEGANRCMWCGATKWARKLEVGHIDGDETNTTPGNLAWTCRPCNQKVAAVMKAAGTGRRTKQYNPAKRKGITDWRDFAEALAITKGEAIGNLEDAIARIHATSARQRSSMQKDIWVIRKDRYGPSGRKDGGALPF